MKKLTWIILVAASISSARAQSPADPDFKATTIQNDDGSVTFDSPEQKVAGQGSLPISAKTTGEQLCAKVGYPIYVGRELRGKDAAKSVEIATSAKSTKVIQKTGGLPNDTVATFVCRLPSLGRWGKKSTRYQSIQTLSDGSAKITQPAFGTIAGETRPISVFSDLNGVCILYGFERYRPASLVASKPTSKYTQTWIDADGRLTYKGFSTGKKISFVSELTCEEESAIRFSENFRYQGLIQALTELTEFSYPTQATFFTEMKRAAEGVAIGRDPGKTLNPNDKDSQNYAALMLLMEPVLRGIDSEIFTTQIIPQFNNDFDHMVAFTGYRTLDRLPKSQQIPSIALRVLSAAVTALDKMVVTATQSEKLFRLKAACGLALGQETSIAALSKFRKQVAMDATVLNDLLENTRTKSIAEAALLAFALTHEGALP